MSFNIKDLFTNGISGILDSSKGIIETFVESPEKRLEAQKVLLEAEHKARELEYENIQKVRDFALQYEGTATQVPKGILILRSLIRPVISLGTFASVMFFIASDIFAKTNWLNSLPNQYWTMVNIVFLFWFGSKMVETSIDKFKKKK